jgi:hypothetical protein
MCEADMHLALRARAPRPCPGGLRRGPRLAHRRGLRQPLGVLRAFTLLENFQKLLVQPDNEENDISRLSHETHEGTHFLQGRAVAIAQKSKKILREIFKTFSYL